MSTQGKYGKIQDEQLWDLVVKKDKAAFEQLYRRYYSPLLAYALSFRYDEEVAKDCIQDLFVKLFSSETLILVKYVKAYLYRSYRNILLDRTDTVTDNVGLEDISATNIMIEDNELVKLFAKEDENLEKSRLLIKAFNQLSANQKNAVYLYYIKEFSWDEMAVSLQISPHSCMNLIARSVAKLRKIIGVEKKK